MSLSFKHCMVLLFAWFVTAPWIAGPAVAASNHVSFAVTMLEASPNPLNQQFRQLIQQKRFNELQALILSGVDINTMDPKRVSPIHVAAYLGSVEAMRMLIQRGVNLKATVFGGWSVMHYAAFGGHVELCNLLAAMGVPLEVTDIGGETPVFYAIESGSLETVKWFVDHKANLKHTNNHQETPFSVAESSGNPEIVAYMKGLQPAKP
ncbi:MAG: ankyrin repeat domain-containing protein [Magnetococcales bacterium]|nr:ankyrin repeat domain-containing protein [Magnetococcales bacterium]